MNVTVIALILATCGNTWMAKKHSLSAMLAVIGWLVVMAHFLIWLFD